MQSSHLTEWQNPLLPQCADAGDCAGGAGGAGGAGSIRQYSTIQLASHPRL